VQETVMNLHRIVCASFLLVQVSSACVAGITHH